MFSTPTYIPLEKRSPLGLGVLTHIPTKDEPLGLAVCSYKPAVKPASRVLASGYRKTPAVIQRGLIRACVRPYGRTQDRYRRRPNERR